MKLKVFTVYDSKVEAFLQPFFAESRGAALRMWQETVNNAQTSIHKYPEDFTLFEIGEYYDDNARFENHVTPISLGLALEFIKVKPVFSEEEKKVRDMLNTRESAAAAHQ